LIVWPFGPVALVHDVLDTEGRELPKDVASYWAQGPIDARLAELEPLLWRKHIEMIMIDTGDDKAGSIEVKHRATTEKDRTHYLASDGEYAWCTEYEDVLIIFGAAYSPIPT
jgi:hypothetical protein